MGLKVSKDTQKHVQHAKNGVHPTNLVCVGYKVALACPTCLSKRSHVDFNNRLCEKCDPNLRARKREREDDVPNLLITVDTGTNENASVLTWPINDSTISADSNENASTLS